MASSSCESSQRPPKRANGGLSYHASSYWDTRFANDPREACGFEWLSPSSSLLSHIPPVILNSPHRILHIGAGTSSLSLDLARYFHQQGGEWGTHVGGLVNVDFSPRSIDFQRSAERRWLDSIGQAEEELMQYQVLDLLDWDQVRRMQADFDVVLDKSTADSISTGEDVRLSSPSAHPALAKLAQRTKHKAVPTIQVLGIHLAAVVKKGGVWLCHSYSADRWADLVLPSDPEAWPWKLGATTAIPVEPTTPNAPQIHHHIYTLHRI